MTDERAEKVKALLADKNFMASALELETPEEVQELFASKGVELSIEDVKALRAAILARLGGDDEMDEDQLEQVAGGAGWDADGFFTNVSYNVDNAVNNIRDVFTSRRRW
ncbi:MAG: hypothetical protein IJ668_03320 [Selenomonadaceae bacterium]|nr:hypothetical protein [Selenomonadaceae bacterium]